MSPRIKSGRAELGSSLYLLDSILTPKVRTWPDY